jgi:hypothetical protein
MAEALQKLLDTITEESPEMRQVLDQAKAGEITPEQAMEAMLEIAQANESLAGAIQAAAGRQLRPLKEAEGGELTLNDLFDPGVGLPKLNPLYEAALIERAQYDGDMPELRTGPMPTKATPAVSVDTDARNPVALGAMLTDASEQVAEQVKEARKDHLGNVARIAEGIPLDQVTADMQASKELAEWGSGKTDAAVYRRAEVPASVKVKRPSGAALAVLGPEERKANAWKFLSTTQGRRTAVPTVAALVQENLRNAHLDVEVGSFEPGESAAQYLWSITIGERGTTQSAFSYIDVAARAITRGLLREVELDFSERFILMVKPHNNLPDREVGWSAHLRRARS